MNPFERLHAKNKVIISGEEREYLFCSEETQSDAIANHPGREYIGASKTMIVDGKEQNFEKTHHFFI